MIIHQNMIFRIDLISNPTVLYVFGDNLQRWGLGGQAKEMRGQPNAVGVATKRTPAHSGEAFFNDGDYEANIKVIAEDYERARVWDEAGGIVVVPASGIGTGLSEMPTRCPRTFAFVCSLGLGGVAT